MIFRSELLNSFSMSAIYYFDAKISLWWKRLGELEKRKTELLKYTVQVWIASPRPFLTILREPCLGRDPYYGNHCAEW